MSKRQKQTNRFDNCRSKLEFSYSHIFCHMRCQITQSIWEVGGYLMDDPTGIFPAPLGWILATDISCCRVVREQSHLTYCTPDIIQCDKWPTKTKAILFTYCAVNSQRYGSWLRICATGLLTVHNLLRLYAIPRASELLDPQSSWR